MTEQRQPLPWADVVAKPEFQQKTRTEQEVLRQQYFDTVVEPHTTPDNYEETWREFDQYSRQLLSAPGDQSTPSSTDAGIIRNTGRRVIDRASDLAGNLTTGVGKVVEQGGEAMTNMTGINPGIVWGDGNGLRATMNMPEEVPQISDALQAGGEAVRDYDADYQPNFTWEKLKGDISVGNLAGYIVEQGGGSIPDMIGAVTMLPAYIASRTEEVATERASNDDREASAKDYGIAAPTAVAMAVLERLGAKGILGEKEVGTAMDLLKESGRAAGKEAGTEFIQEGMEYTATNAGTEAGFTVGDLVDRSMAGAVAGGGIGGVGRAVTGGAEIAGIKQSAEGRQSRAEQLTSEVEAAEAEYEAHIEAVRAKMRGDFEPEAPRIEGAQAVPQPDFYAGTDGTVTAEQQTQREMPQAEPEAQQQPSLEPQGITFEDWDDANDAITFDESDIEPEIANIAEMAEFAGMVGVPRQAIESALSLNDEQETISALEDMVASAQAEMNPPEVTPDAVDPRAESQNPEQAGQPEPALRGEPENRPEAAGIPRAPESSRPENGAEATAEPNPDLTPVPAEVEAPQTRAQTVRDKARARAERQAAPETPPADDDLVSVTMPPVSPAPAAPAQDIDTAANEAATSLTNDLPEPTEAQKAAGNYRKGHVNIQGLDVSIENPRGSTRRGTDPDGNEWAVEMKAHYGAVRGTEGADGDAVDVFVGPNPESDQVFVVDQVNPDGTFDEVKALIGYNKMISARRGYLANYSRGWKGLGRITKVSMGDFKEWLNNGDTTKPFSEAGTARSSVPAGVSNLADNETALPQSEKQKVSSVRSARNQGLPGVEGELQDVSGPYRQKAESGIDTGKDRQRPGVQPREREVGDSTGASPESPEQQVAEARREGDAGGRLGKRDGDSAESSEAAARAVRVERGESSDNTSRRSQKEQQDANPQREDSADGGLGEGAGNETGDAQRQVRQARVERRKGTDDADPDVAKSVADADIEATKQPAAGGIAASEAQAVADRLNDKLPGIVTVVQSVEELPARYKFMRQAGASRGPRGFFDPETNEVFLIADNIKDSAEAERTYLHEVVGHFGIRLAFGNELNGYLDRLYKQIPTSKLKPFMDRYGLKEHKAADRRVAVEEYIAHTAELNGRKPHWFKRLIARVRDWLRSIGVVRNWTNDDLYALIAQSNNPTVDTMLAQSMASLSNLRRQMDSADDNVRLAKTDDGNVTADDDTDSALGMLYGFAYAGHTVYPVNPAATNAETLFRHYGYEGNIDADAAVNVAGQYSPVQAVVGKTPGSGRASFDFKIVDTESALPYAVMMPSAGARRGVALYQAAMDWAHNNGKKLRPDPAGLSPVNYLRRSEAMLASMMRNGTSRHLEPDYTQFSGFLDDSQYGPLAAGEYSPETNSLLKQFKDRLWGNEGQGSAGEAVARANSHNMAAAALALTLRRKPELLNYRADSQGNIYEIPPNAGAKPKRIAGPATAIREIQKTITVSDAANGVGARTALRAILAQSALLGPNGPRDIAGAISAITDSLALFQKGQVEKMPARALLPDVVIRRMARAYSNEAAQQQRIYYSLKDPEKPRTVDDIINLKHQTPLARAVSWASKQGAGLTGQKYGALTLRQLSEVSRMTLPHIKAYVATIHRMMTRRNQMAEDAVTIANDVQKWAARNAAEADTLFDLMHEATLAEVDPAEPFVSRKDMLNDRVKVLTERIKNVGGESAQSGRKKRLTDELADIKKQIKDEPRREINHNRLSPIWEKLSPEAKKHYKTMKAKYEQRHEIFMKLMEARIQNADIEQHVKRQMIAEMRYEFESNTLGGVYFPLARFGDYWVETNDENGERLFTTYESERDQKRVVKELTAAKMPVTSGKFLQGSGEVDGVSLGFVQEVMETIDSSNVNEQLSSELGDAVYQLYLQALPTRSMRKNFIHRKGVQGFHRDAIRTFADNMMKGSHQLARLEYQDELSDLMVDMKKAAQKGSNTAADLYNEMVKRHEWVMNPANSTVAQKLTSIGFIWMLGITPAAALVNTTQNLVVALPVLASKFGWAAAAKELVKTSGEFLGSTPGAVTDRVKGEKDGRPWSIRNALKGAEREAYDELVDLGVIDVTMAHNLAGIAETDAYRYSDTGHKVMSVVSYLFHKAEVYNRETSGIAAYRLAKASGMEHPKAVQYAADAVWDSHFDYTNTNRARFMQPNWAKVAFQFKQYSQNITYYLVRNAKRAMYDPALGMFGKNASTTKEEQREAAVQLAGTLGITLGLGGLTTMPMIGVINSLTNMLLDDDEDEPFDAETEVKQWIVEKVGQDLGERIIWGAGGAGLSSRVTLDGLWVRDPYRDMMGEDLWTHYAQQAMGPVIGGVFVSAFRGMQDISEGRPWTGVEKFLPKAFKDASKAVRYHTEGATTRQGYQLKEDWTFGELALQGLGIADHDLMRRYDANSAIRGYDEKIANRRGALLQRFYMAASQGDRALMNETLAEIERFNEKNPTQPITRRSVQSSINTRRRNMATAQAGMRMDRGLQSIKERFTYGD